MKFIFALMMTLMSLQLFADEKPSHNCDEPCVSCPAEKKRCMDTKASDTKRDVAEEKTKNNHTDKQSADHSHDTGASHQ